MEDAHLGGHHPVCLALFGWLQVVMHDHVAYGSGRRLLRLGASRRGRAPAIGRRSS
jgi:hypothetical protein